MPPRDQSILHQVAVLAADVAELRERLTVAEIRIAKLEHLVQKSEAGDNGR